MAQAEQSMIRVGIAEDIATLTINRPEKRNAINDALISELGAFFANPPKGVNAVCVFHAHLATNSTGTWPPVP